MAPDVISYSNLMQSDVTKDVVDFLQMMHVASHLIIHIMRCQTDILVPIQGAYNFFFNVKYFILRFCLNMCLSIGKLCPMQM